MFAPGLSGARSRTQRSRGAECRQRSCRGPFSRRTPQLWRYSQRSPALGYTPIGLLDDDSRKRNLRLHGVRVLGTTADLAHVIRDRRPDEVLITQEVRQRLGEKVPYELQQEEVSVAGLELRAYKVRYQAG